MVFEGFPVLYKVGICDNLGGFGFPFCEVFGTLGDILVVWKGPGTTVEFQWISGPPRSHPNPEPGRGGRWIRKFLGPSNRSQIADLLFATAEAPATAEQMTTYCNY